MKNDGIAKNKSVRSKKCNKEKLDIWWKQGKQERVKKKKKHQLANNGVNITKPNLVGNLCIWEEHQECFRHGSRWGSIYHSSEKHSPWAQAHQHWESWGQRLHGVPCVLCKGQAHALPLLGAGRWHVWVVHRSDDMFHCDLFSIQWQVYIATQVHWIECQPLKTCRSRNVAVWVNFARACI